jgi:predicted nucleic acid-binding protein
MILVDTSVWVEFLRSKRSAVVSALSELLDQDQVSVSPIIVMELLSGAPAREWDRLERLLSAPVQRSLPEDWERRVRPWIHAASRKGDRFGVADLLIASTAQLHGDVIWSLDSDFARMEKLGWISRFVGKGIT